MTVHHERTLELVASLAPARAAQLAIAMVECASMAPPQLVACRKQDDRIRLAGRSMEPDDPCSMHGILTLIEQFAGAADDQAR
jgi:hypothetical protein